MKKKNSLLARILFLSLLLSLGACSVDNDYWNMEEDVVLERNQLVFNPPVSGTTIDSFKYALTAVIVISDAQGVEGWVDSPGWFQFCYDNNINAVVTVTLTVPHIVKINRSLLWQYNWKGYLLIALHEWFHIFYAANVPNEEAHEQMVTRDWYHWWIEQLIGCTRSEARLLAYVGLEASPVYEKLSYEEKQRIKKVAEDWVLR